MPTNTKALQVAEPVGFVAGKNKIINGDFGIWQRGTSFTGSSLPKIYFADRFYVYFTGNGSPSFSATRQNFTPGTAPVSGYESPFFARFACTNVGSGVTSRDIWQPIEDVRTLAGQTVTLSYWAKASTSLSISPMWSQVFGSGGSAENANVLSPVTLTTSWQRFTVTFTLTSMSGKTIGDASNALYIGFRFPTDLFQIDMWGIQLEAGSVATPFQTATGTVQGELAACQRYYQRFNADGSGFTYFGIGSGHNTGSIFFSYWLKQKMRAVPTVFETSGVSTFFAETHQTSTVTNLTSILLPANVSSTDILMIEAQKSASFTAGQFYRLVALNNGNAYIAVGAEF